MMKGKYSSLFPFLILIVPAYVFAGGKRMCILNLNLSRKVLHYPIEACLPSLLQSKDHKCQMD